MGMAASAGIVLFAALLLAGMTLALIPVSVSAQSCTCEGHGYGYGGGCCHPSQGQSCGYCGTIACDGSCTGQGVCSPGQTRCSGGTYQTCTSSCGWSNAGTDADGDGVDAQCGDAVCDNEPARVDSQRIAIETGYCTDSIDNDCDGLVDRDDMPECCYNLKRECLQLTESTFNIVQWRAGSDPDTRLSAMSEGSFFACGPDDGDTACCVNPDACVFGGQCYDPGQKLQADLDVFPELCRATNIWGGSP